MESVRSHAVLHAAGISSGTLRRSVALMMALPTLVLGFVGLVAGVLVGPAVVPGGPGGSSRR